MLYSVRMRAAAGGAHEAGGRHISGAERLVTRQQVAAVTAEMQERAWGHSRGEADFINIRIEKIAASAIRYVPVLPVRTRAVKDLSGSRQAAVEELSQAGVSNVAAAAGMAALSNLSDSLRGAMLLCAVTGQRLDGQPDRGIRVSRMDSADPASFAAWLTNQGLATVHTREALTLASKVLGQEGIVAELCWSDDPEYTTGYVASRGGYVRLPFIKPAGSAIGGRVFFVHPESELQDIITYLERQPVLVQCD